MNLTNFLADPAEVESVSFDTCPGVVEKYQHVEDIHWAVRPLAIVFGLFTAMKLTMFVGCSVSTRVKKCRRNGHDGHAGDEFAGTYSHRDKKLSAARRWHLSRNVVELKRISRGDGCSTEAAVAQRWWCALRRIAFLGDAQERERWEAWGLRKKLSKGRARKAWLALCLQA
ncbi:Uncharacterized protein TCM_001194 [Theobroma cacao]|uniref:Uncharacterized protein n=1 Tax=Theobroma cacao TaxID=3641 RepID=A0A061DI65_THECC|nr:Uncharacterized protein TCM_001194 [Theobroma cacao]